MIERYQGTDWPLSQAELFDAICARVAEDVPDPGLREATAAIERLPIVVVNDRSSARGELVNRTRVLAILRDAAADPDRACMSPEGHGELIDGIHRSCGCDTLAPLPDSTGRAYRLSLAWLESVGALRTETDVCPDCKFTAYEIGMFHIHAQQAAALAHPLSTAVPPEMAADHDAEGGK